MANFILKCCHFVWVSNFFLLHSKECNEYQAKRHTKNEEDTDRDKCLSFNSKVCKAKVTGNNTSCHNNGKKEKVELPWNVNFSYAVNLLEITNDLIFWLFSHMMNIEPNFTGFPTEIFFRVFNGWTLELIRFQFFERYRKDNTVPSDICIPIIRLKHVNNNSNITNLI